MAQTRLVATGITSKTDADKTRVQKASHEHCLINRPYKTTASSAVPAVKITKGFNETRIKTHWQTQSESASIAP